MMDRRSPGTGQRLNGRVQLRGWWTPIWTGLEPGLEDPRMMDRRSPGTGQRLNGQVQLRPWWTPIWTGLEPGLEDQGKLLERSGPVSSR
ncbi:hypothetical protein I79_017448 [Cricetulus griseus]|uniref:Uncharacterized protein n=1 Tax=Cricetulus griseus TaxID=10029 RepID=G3I224_CRIGR|nr:hypothetical protein I79_017448 [Cricetulus griseus]